MPTGDGNVTDPLLGDCGGGGDGEAVPSTWDRPGGAASVERVSRHVHHYCYYLLQAGHGELMRECSSSTSTSSSSTAAAVGQQTGGCCRPTQLLRPHSAAHDVAQRRRHCDVTSGGDAKLVSGDATDCAAGRNHVSGGGGGGCCGSARVQRRRCEAMTSPDSANLTSPDSAHVTSPDSVDMTSLDSANVQSPSSPVLADVKDVETLPSVLDS